MKKTQSLRTGADSVEVFVAGDLCPDTNGRGQGTNCMLKDGPEKTFGKLAEYISRADLAVVNLEAPLLNSGSPIIKCGPNLKANPALAKVLHQGGFNVVNLANNHIRDYGPAGVKQTVEALEKESIPWFGAGETPQEASRPKIIKRNGLRIGFLAFAENEFGNVDQYGWGAARIDPLANIEAISEASKKCDVLLVIVHGGCELCPVPSPGAVQRYRHYARAGASAVIVNHSHVPLGWETHKNVPVFYGLGNFLFPWPQKRSKMWYCGIALRLTCEKDKPVKFKVIPIESTPDALRVDVMQPDQQREFNEYLKSLCKPLADHLYLVRVWNAWCVKRGGFWLAPFHVPESNRSKSDQKQLAAIENMVRCEAHREVGLTYLQLLRNRKVGEARKGLAELKALEHF